MVTVRIREAEMEEPSFFGITEPRFESRGSFAAHAQCGGTNDEALVFLGCLWVQIYTCIYVY